jgi:hypothetical protein
MNDWHDVNDKLPKKHKTVFVAYHASKSIGIAIGIYQHNLNRWLVSDKFIKGDYYDCCYDTVTHWKEIDIDYPESYKEFIK